MVFQKGAPVAFDEELAKKLLQADKVRIVIAMNDGDGAAKAWGCDLTEQYVQINASYRS